MGQRLYVGNLSFDTNAETVRTLFSEVGEVTDVHVVMDRETGRSRGFAFVTMGSPGDAERAITALNGTVLEGRPLRVNEAEERRRPPNGGGGLRGGDRDRGGRGGRDRR
jgi:RNA recognition motif-containing protein